MRRTIALLVLACAVLVAACGGGGPLESTVASIDPDPTATSATVPSSPKPPTVTPTVRATATEVPATATASPSPTALPTATSLPAAAPEAIAYIDEALDIIMEHSIYRDRLDVETVRQGAIERAAGAMTPEDAWDAVRYIVRQLNDPHSYFVEPGVDVMGELEDPNLQVPQGQRLENDIGYVVVPEIRSGLGDRERYTVAGIEVIRTIDEEPVCGWIIDLRGNRGGRGFTMLASIAPILGDGEIGAYTADTGEIGIIALENGQVSFEGDVWTEGPVYELQRPWPPVAVLYGRLTGSSGELVAISFRGRPDSRSFGQATGGAPTVPVGYELSDGAILVLASARMTDRTGEAFDGPVPPDVVVFGGRAPGVLVNDPVVGAAIEWLLEHPSCSSE